MPDSSGSPSHFQDPPKISLHERGPLVFLKGEQASLTLLGWVRVWESPQPREHFPSESPSTRKTFPHPGRQGHWQGQVGQGFVPVESRLACEGSWRPAGCPGLGCGEGGGREAPLTCDSWAGLSRPPWPMPWLIPARPAGARTKLAPRGRRPLQRPCPRPRPLPCLPPFGTGRPGVARRPHLPGHWACPERLPPAWSAHRGLAAAHGAKGRSPEAWAPPPGWPRLEVNGILLCELTEKDKPN